MTDQTEGKKEEGLKWGEWEVVSIGFPFGGLEEPNIYHNLGDFTRMWEFYLEEFGQGCRIIWQGFY